MLGERFTSVPGSSDYFVGGFITYTNEMKMELLGVPPEMLEEFGAVSKETAEAMAVGARRRTGSTYALSITGVAGPDSGGEKAPVGSMYVGIADAAGTHVAHRQFHWRPDADPRVHLPDGARCVAAADAGKAVAKAHSSPLRR